MKKQSLTKQEDTAFMVIEITEERRFAISDLILSSYLGEECKFCHKIFNRIEELDNAVWYPWEKGRIAHKECWSEKE